MNAINLKFIDTINDLNEVVRYIYENEILEIGVDLESNSLYRYKHDICLLQISAGSRIFLIDTLELKLPKVLKDVLENSKITKVFQDMQYDLALLKFNHDCDTKNTFDISVADRLIRRSNDNRKLDKIIEDYLDIKGQVHAKSQKSNWGIRPLTESQIKYAAFDVMYLTAIYYKVIKILAGGFRWECLKEYTQNYQPKDYRRKYNINSMWKLKDIESLSQSQLFKLQNLLVARDKIGREQNRPLYWICKDNTLLELAKSNVRNEKEIKRFFENNGDYNRFINKGLDSIVRAYMLSNQSNTKLELPDFSISLKTWIPLKEEVGRDYFPDPQRLSIIKSWQNDVIKELGLIPEFLREKGQTGYLASLSKSNWDKNIIFPGIPPKVQKLLIADLKLYMSTLKSNIRLQDLDN